MILDYHIELLVVLYILGITVESITGAISAIKNDMDIFGMLVIAVITALGGGTIRNIILGVYPMIWIQYPVYLIITILGALSAVILSKFVLKLRYIFLILDAIGLVTFSYIGCHLGYKITNSYIIAISMGVVTGVSGGMLRDILCGNIPLVFKSELYASISIVIGALVCLSIYLEISHIIIVTIAILFIGISLRLYVVYKNIYLPFLKYKPT